MKRLMAALLTASCAWAALTSADAKADEAPDCVSYEIRWGGQYWQGSFDKNDGEKPCGYEDEPGCCIYFTDVLTAYFKGDPGHSDWSVDSYGKGLPYTIYRDDVAIATGVSEYGQNGGMWFTDYDVVPGRTYKYEIKVRGEDVDRMFGADSFCDAGVTNRQEYTTGPLNVECYFIYTAEFEPGEVVFDENGGEREVGISIYRQTASESFFEKYEIYNDLSSNVEWARPRVYLPSEAEWWNKSIVIEADENDTNEAREGIVTVYYWTDNNEGFEWQIKVSQGAKPGSAVPDPESAPTPTPEPTPEPEEVHELYTAVDGAVPDGVASEYNGYLFDAKGVAKGTIKVKLGKAKADKNTKKLLASLKASVVLGAKNVMLKGADKVEILANGPTTVSLVGGESCEVTLGAKGLSGTYGAYFIDGARNFFTSKNGADQTAANGVLGKWQDPINVVWDGGSVNVAIAAKGKAKVKGTLADGKTKVSAKATLLVGKEWCCVPVVAPKANLAFAIWLPVNGQDARSPSVVDLDGAVVGKPKTLVAGAKFHMDAAKFAAVLGQAALPYLPDGVSVSQSGAKWVVAGGAKAGKIAMKGGVLDDSKAGVNPSGLKLTYKAKEGSFKGSFKAYANNGGSLKATTVNVSGMVVDGVGYGTATIKGGGGVAVTIE